MKNLPPDQDRTIEDYFAPLDIHEAQREERKGYATFVAAFLLLVVETLLLRAAFSGQISIASGLMLHGIIVAWLAGYACLSLSGGEGRFAMLLLMMGAATGPFGGAGMMLSIAVYLWSSRRTLGFNELFKTLFPSLAKNQSQYIYDEIRSGRDESAQTYNVIPFLDVLTFGDEVQKRQALAKMNSSFHPNFAAAFKKALNDSNNTIRVQAATAIAKIESQFQDRAMKLAELRERHGADPVVVWALAELYDDYSHTGILDAEREKNNRQKALEYYQDYLRLKPADPAANARIGRIFMRNKDYEQACNWFSQCIEQENVLPAIPDWYSEALFLSGRYDELRRYQARLASGPTHDASMQPALKEAMALWAEDKK